MNKRLLYTLTVGVASVLPFAMNAGPATPATAPNGSDIQTQLRINVKDDVNTLFLRNSNNDPDIITKTYVLKNIDPYELIPYIRGVVGGERITGGTGHVEAIKYMDGTGILIVSAEDYKFEKSQQNGGMSIDEVVAALDQPNATSSSGQPKFIYFPKYRDATTLSNLLANVGLQDSDQIVLQDGRDRVSVDTELNAMLFDSPAYSNKTLREWLSNYDQPIPEVKIKCTVYEIGLENDGKVGTDFQAWKNGPGSDLFSTAARASSGFGGVLSNGITGAANASKFGSTKYIRFSPRWNTRFLDFLVSKGNAKVVTSGELSVRNAEQGFMSNTTYIPYLQDKTALTDESILDYQLFDNASFWAWGTTAAATATGDYTLRGYTEDGALVTFKTTLVTGSIRVTRVRDASGIDDAKTPYYIECMGGTINVNGKEMRTAKCYRLQMQQEETVGTLSDVTFNWTTDKNLTISQDFQRSTKTKDYGFTMRVTPSICENATTVAVNLQNTSLLGFEENDTANSGGARTSTSEVNTNVLVNNNGSKFIIGGLDKQSTVKSVAKVPWLGSIPVLGWFFTSESEVTKKAQLVTVLEVVPVTPSETANDEEQKVIKTVNDANVEAGETNSYGFDQFLLDSDKKGLDPLP